MARVGSGYQWIRESCLPTNATRRSAFSAALCRRRANGSEHREAFETISASEFGAEIGSRAFVNLFVVGDEVYDAESGWSVLQVGRCRYAVAQPEQPLVRIVLSEYLAAEVVLVTRPCGVPRP